MFKKVLLIGFIVSMLFTPMVARAESCQPGKGALGGIPTWYKYLPGEKKGDNCSIKTDGLGGTAIILVMLGIFDILLFVAGFAAVIFIIWGGFKYLTSAGEPQKATAGRTTILNALIGLVIAFVAARIVGFIAGRLLA